MSDLSPSPFPPLMAELEKMKKSNLTAAIGNVDSIIQELERARAQIDGETDSHKISRAMTLLQNPVKAKFEAITDDLKAVTKGQRNFGKALDKALPHRELPMTTDAMGDQSKLINRAISMHFLREGQFKVASTFLEETSMTGSEHRAKDEDDDTAMGTEPAPTDQDGDLSMNDEEGVLEGRFAEMYSILGEIKAMNLEPAIEWATRNSEELDARGSNLEFELNKLQYVWLFRSADGYNGGREAAMRYATSHFHRFHHRHLREIGQLSCALVYATNLSASPYYHLFNIDSAFEDMAQSFTREFCSMLGLSAESPLYVAVTAGAIALPRLLKYTVIQQQKTEWTTENELAFETPLPPSMIYHPIFVCPVSKDQVTEDNPAMMLTCGHVIASESLNSMAKSSRFKCPYCPQEGYVRDVIKIRF